MSFFGETLKSHIENNDVNIYKLARKSGIERTAIHKIMSAGRMPDVEYVQKLINAMQASPYERDELWAAYNISKDGELLYNQRLKVKSLIDRMNAAFEIPDFVSAPPLDVLPQSKAAVQVTHGGLAVNNMLDDVLTREVYADNPQVYFFMPYDYEFFFDNLFIKYHWNNEFKIKCLFEFSKSGNIHLKQRNENLDVIGMLLPFIMRSHGNFDAYYFYSSSPLRDRSVLPMPYYLLTSQCAVTMNAEMQTAILYYDSAVTECYKQIFNNAKTKANPLVSNITSMLETVNYYGSKTGVTCNGISGFGSHPCITHFLDKDMINAHLSAELPNRDMLVDMTTAVYQHMHETSNNGISTSYFTIEGLNIFVERGLIETLSDRIFLPFTIDERKNILKRMIIAVETDSPIYRLINTSKMKTPKCFYVDVFSGSHMNIVVGERTGGEVNTVNISEESIVESFHDFLINAMGTDVVYSKEDTLHTLHNSLNKL